MGLRGRSGGNYPGLKHLLAICPSTAKTVEKHGLDAFDPKLASKVISMLSAAVLEEGLAAGDLDVPLYKRVDWALKSAPLISQLKEEKAKEQPSKYPETEKAVQEEIASLGQRVANLLTSINKNLPVAVDTALDIAEKQEEKVN